MPPPDSIDFHEAIAEHGDLWFRMIFESSPDAYFVVDLSRGAKIIACNASTERILRGPREEILGKTPGEHSPPTQPDGRPTEEAVEEVVGKALERGRHDFEWMHRRLDGEDFWAHVNLVITTLGGRQIGIGAWREIGDRKRTQAELQRELEMKRSLLAFASDGIVILDLDGAVVEVNDRFCDLLERSRDEVLGSSITSWDGHYRTTDELRELLHSHYAGERVEFQTVLRTAEEELVQVEVSGAPLEVEGQKLVFYSTRDITQRKRAERRVAEVLDLNAKLLESIGLGVSAYHELGPCVLINETAARMVGASVREGLAQNFRELESWKRSGLLDAAERALASNSPVIHEIHTKSSFGLDVWLEVRLNTFLAGGAQHLLLVIDDISEKRHAERERRVLAAIVQGSADAILGADLDGTITAWNPAAEKLFGYSAEEALGQQISMLWPAEIPPEEPAALERMKGGDETVCIETRRRCSDGREIDVTLTLSSIRADDGAVLGVAAIVRPIDRT